MCLKPQQFSAFENCIHRARPSSTGWLRTQIYSHTHSIVRAHTPRHLENDPEVTIIGHGDEPLIFSEPYNMR